MKISDLKCRLCSENITQASKRGAYLSRMNEKGVDPIMECRPNCGQTTGNQDDALLRAIENNPKEE